MNTIKSKRQTVNIKLDTERHGHFSVDDVKRIMTPLTKDKKAAQTFFRSIGVVFHKNGEVSIKPR